MDEADKFFESKLEAMDAEHTYCAEEEVEPNSSAGALPAKPNQEKRKASHLEEAISEPIKDPKQHKLG
jgi:hypothetical protein